MPKTIMMDYQPIDVDFIQTVRRFLSVVRGKPDPVMRGGKKIADSDRGKTIIANN